ncbi:probable type I restriction modification system methylase [Photobacterium angustum S14]|uniref:Probable type I restriction modification system methylase n=1 Tax=Photobacterium angustum (strain S14 / CCUG 15956) TaxID=314292 RepID=Q1ZMN8_PHOAS|nr:restriction endonuclease subunit S [Photobacterium angustum]EAS63401.1 probable type I restriction modification system methylase [Photobacterium angustum S14]
MSSNWLVLTLGDVCERITDGAHKSPKSVDDGKPMASVKDLTRFGVDLSNARKISKNDFDELVQQGCKPQVGDVLIAKDGNSALDTVCTVDTEIDAVLLSSVAILRPDPEKLDSNFLKYYFCSPQVIDYLKTNFISGAAIPRVVLRDFRKAEINLPPIETQRKISQYLSSIDNKIFVNSKINQTLEQMAQAIFKSWFVDFDPVKAKMNGKQPEGMDAATASLFPEKLVESELGLIPDGWEVKNVGDFTDTFDYVANGSFAALKANVELYDEPNEVIYVRTTDFNKGFKNDLKYTDEPSYQFLSKSKLYGHETIISNVGDVGTVFRAPSWYDMPMTLGSNAMGIVSKGANSYIYYMFKSHIGQHLLDGITSGSAQMKFNKTSFRKLRVVLPSKEVLAKFEELEDSLWAKHASNQKESLHLERLRDTLLPKLLSGEIELEISEEL